MIDKKTNDEIQNEESIQKLKPYDRLQSILSEKNEGKLTENASSKISFLLNEKPNIFVQFLTTIKNLFSKIDTFLFKESKMTNYYRRRK